MAEAAIKAAAIVIIGLLITTGFVLIHSDNEVCTADICVEG